MRILFYLHVCFVSIQFFKFSNLKFLGFLALKLIERFDSIE